MKSKIPPIEIDTKEYEKFKLLTKQEGKSVSATIRDMVKKYNEKKLGKKKEKGYDFMAKYRINLEGSGVTSTNYKDYLYGDKSEFAKYGNS